MRMMGRWTSVAICLLFPLNILAQAPAPEAPPKPLVPADPAPLLRVIPGDATALVGVSSLRQLDAHVQDFTQLLQLQGFVPGPIEALKTSTGIDQGLNEDGPIAM